jgi:NAD/NADP transhydrogenase alpha subunit
MGGSVKKEMGGLVEIDEWLGGEIWMASGYVDCAPRLANNASSMYLNLINFQKLVIKCNSEMTNTLLPARQTKR